MTIHIVELREGGKKHLRDFLDIVRDIYAGDPAYIRPLDMDVEDRLNPKKNPFFEHGEATAFVAYRNGKCVGRISAQIDRAHLERHKDDAGFFGFFDTIDDAEVAKALLDKAASWAVGRGMKKLRGPLSLNINEEAGCLVEGFEHPPVIMMPHHRPYQGGLIEQAGLSKVKDLFAWTYAVGTVPLRAQKAHDDIVAMPEVTVRPVDPRRMLDEVRVIMDIFNDAWSDNWGFVPLSQSELAKMASDMKLILVPELTFVVSIEGKPAAVALGLPNINEMIGDFDGKLSLVTIPKLLWRLKMRGAKSGRLIILGVRKEYRNVRRFAGLSAYLYVAMNHAAQKLGMTHGELGWTLEDNAAINAGIRLMGGRVYKKYRVYERSL
ncbi:MAG: hypothetical protein IPM54_33985 [Polyangiaceae bacterium]|nr:hypothetical protein [Polyangiaceae bacterium]